MNKNPTYATVYRYLFTAKLLYMFRVSQHPSSGVLKTVSAASGTGHTTCTATPLLRGLIWTGLCESSGHIQYILYFLVCKVTGSHEDSQFSAQMVFVVLRILNTFVPDICVVSVGQSVGVYGSFYGFKFLDWSRFYFEVL